MFFGPGTISRLGSRHSSSKPKTSWNQAHLALVTKELSSDRKQATSQRLSPELKFGERPQLLVLEGGISFDKARDGSRLADECETALAVEILFDSSSRTFEVKLSNNAGELIESRSGRKTNHVLLTLGFVSVNGKKVRIPWKKIEAGLIWKQSVEMRESFFDDLAAKARLNELRNSNAERLAPRS